MAELLLMLALVLLVFGWGRLPQLGTNIQQAIINFKAMVQGGHEIDVTPIAQDATEQKESRHVR